MMNHLDGWNAFCDRYHVSNDAQPLFETDDDLNVAAMEHKGTTVLRRSEAVDEMIGKHREKLIFDAKTASPLYDGLIYILCRRSDDSTIIPIYIGIAESVGTKQAISGNIRDKGAWCRWGYTIGKKNKQGKRVCWHLGYLSEVVLRQECLYSQEAKWVQKCFHCGTRQLSEQLYLWTTPWPRAGVGVWSDFGPTPLPLLEATLVGVASLCFPDTLSNVKGVPRR